MINMKMNNNDWWKRSVIYQIYPRSFQDSNNDGIGDIRGIISRLDYLEFLGINGIWLSPVFRSPQDDNGYDVSDYQDIDPMFGTMQDMEDLIREAEKRGIKIILDLVLNHSSDEHNWFKEALKSRDNPYHDYYVWRDGTEGAPPNDMQSVFGGSAWQWVPPLNQYYFHQFSVKQPDLNWDNPILREEIYKMVRFWIERGVGGFRLDVIDQIAKVPDEKITNNGPMLHTYIKELRRRGFVKDDLVTVGEAWGATPDIARKFSSPDGTELSMVFQFEHILLDQIPGQTKWDTRQLPFLELKRVMNKWQEELNGKGWNSLFWNNHDLPRIVSRWGNDNEDYREISAKMLATILYGMQGTPFIYQGEELGMTNLSMSIDEYKDIETLQLYKERKSKGYSEDEIMASIHARGRDNARTPMQWDNTLHAGFTKGIPWIKVNPNSTYINAADQMKDKNSVMMYYRELIRLRKELDVISEGTYVPVLEEDEDFFAYYRELDSRKMLVLANFHAATRECPIIVGKEYELLLTNYSEGMEGQPFRPYEARIYYKSK